MSNDDDEWEKVETSIKELKIKAELEQKETSSVVIPARFLNMNNNMQNELNFFQDSHQQSQNNVVVATVIYPTVEFTVDSTLQDALTNARERMQLLNIENMVLSFVQSSDRAFDLPATQYNAFRRLLIYRVAQRFRLEHVTNDIINENNERGIVITMYKTPDVCYPKPLLIDVRFDNMTTDSSSYNTEPMTQQSSSDQQMPPSQQANSSSKKVLVMRRSTSKSNECLNKDSSNTKNQQSAAEKEKAYAAARARIFGGESSGAGDEWALTFDTNTKIVETSSSSSSSSLPPEPVIPTGISTPNASLIKNKSKSAIDVTAEMPDTNQINNQKPSMNKSTSTNAIAGGTISKSKSTEISNISGNNISAAKSTKKSNDSTNNKLNSNNNNANNNSNNNLASAKLSTTHCTALATNSPSSNTKQNNTNNTNCTLPSKLLTASSNVQKNNNGANNSNNCNSSNVKVESNRNSKSQLNSKNSSPPALAPAVTLPNTPQIEKNLSKAQTTSTENIVNGYDSSSNNNTNTNPIESSVKSSSTSSSSTSTSTSSSASSSSSKSNNGNNSGQTGKNSRSSTSASSINNNTSNSSKKIVTNPTTWKDASKFTLRDKDAERSDPDFTRRTNITTSSNPSPPIRMVNIPQTTYILRW